MKGLISQGLSCWRSLLGAVIFYTCIPLPSHWKLEFERIARWAPLIGVGIGGLLGVVDRGLAAVEMPLGMRSAVEIALWVALTGGLHLDGAMDAADGLAVGDPQRRLAVMRDSHTGAFGAIALVLLLLLKFAALSELHVDRGWGLAIAAGWGRWGQVAAIALYPYLRTEGKGAFHKTALKPPQDVLLGFFVLLGLSRWQFIVCGQGGEMVIVGSAIALLVGFWFYRQLGGHTGDTYGAVVEWTEAFLLCIFATL
ncbi:adenosylcobinamide-GDP ribazoletransferase [Lusitaniella coriacea LEGE 07157]|uniref:Adenosylcobinamide-GDP ribazoletransferase n=1 Tax=Lusitaniella coriacea LEGE 07157 TaxID=945747 RepID=A0A8J7ANM9_9CYAN|nr:adenosylcobinamide-GDP ribazoletransferase [Lusitaniella coriacea]MBE9115053.1 adenosylcobinamide-GDP ribazoletransferase [Lusitaniella coriacea LEGE 07157]